MQDGIRDMALWIACENGKKNKFVVKERVELIKGHDLTKWKEEQRISVWHSGIEECMVPPSFPNLETLLSVGRFPFPSGFFRYIPAIRVLALGENYELTKLPVEIGELVTLQYLNLSVTGIEELPMELKKLTNLRCLILDHMRQLKTIPDQMISNLSSLESFSAYNSGATSGDCRALLQELESLEHLNEISITLTRVLPVKRLLKSPKLRRGVNRLNVGSCNYMSLINVSPRLRKLEINRCDDLEDVKINVEKERGWGSLAYNMAQSNLAKHQNLCNLGEVKISECPKLLNLTWLVYATRLQFLDVSFCDSMEEVLEDKREWSFRYSARIRPILKNRVSQFAFSTESKEDI